MRDAVPIYAIRSLPEVAEWATNHPTDPDAWENGFGEQLGNLLVVELDEGLIGDLTLRIEDPWAQAEVREMAAGKQAEIGYVVNPAYGGRGYATEAARELLRICFEWVGVRRVIASCFADNIPSWRLLERLGMRREQHTVKDSLHRSGEWLDGFGYALLEEEWRVQRSPVLDV